MPIKWGAYSSKKKLCAKLKNSLDTIPSPPLLVVVEDVDDGNLGADVLERGGARPQLGYRLVQLKHLAEEKFIVKQNSCVCESFIRPCIYSFVCLCKTSIIL